MKRVIITGATGMVGGLVLTECLKNPEIVSVTSIVRKSSGVKAKAIFKTGLIGGEKTVLENKDIRKVKV